MRPVTPTEWRDAAGDVGCCCDHVDPELCDHRIGTDPCACCCHYQPDLRVIAGGHQESPMRRRRPRTFRLYERLADGPRRYVAPAACDDCGTTNDDEHATWCRSAGNARAVHAASHHVGSVHETAPGEA
jgi:hypothetical protein